MTKDWVYSHPLSFELDLHNCLLYSQEDNIDIFFSWKTNCIFTVSTGPRQYSKFLCWALHRFSHRFRLAWSLGPRRHCCPCSCGEYVHRTSDILPTSLTQNIYLLLGLFHCWMEHVRFFPLKKICQFIPHPPTHLCFKPILFSSCSKSMVLLHGTFSALKNASISPSSSQYELCFCESTDALV